MNGTFTESVDINRDVRQCCPLSMDLYILSLEPLIYKINNNPNIKGIHTHNLNKEIKTVQHADDNTVIITTSTSFKHLERENLENSKISGAKINEQKTEIL